MRSLLTANLLLVWSSATALAGDAVPVAGLQLRGMESAAVSAPEQPAVKSSAVNKKRKVSSSEFSLRPAAAPDYKAQQSNAQTPAAAPVAPDTSNVQVDDTTDVWGGETNATVATPRQAPSPAIVQINLLRGHSSDFSGPADTETLRQSSFGDIGKGVYKVPPMNGHIALNGMAGQALKPFTQHRKSRALPIADISIAAMVLLTLILGRSFLASMRRNKARRTRVS